MLAARDLLSLSDDELQLVHEAVPGHALWSCVLCCKRLRTAALASGGLAHAAAAAGDLASMKRADLRGCPLSRTAWAGTLCHIAAARNDLPMLRWALANGWSCGPHGSVVMELAIVACNMEMARAIHEHGCVYDIGRAYEIAAIKGHLAIVQWLYEKDHDSMRSMFFSLRETLSFKEAYSVVQRSSLKRALGINTVLAVGRSSKNGHLEVLKWLTARGLPAIWSQKMRRFILSAAARGGHLHIIEWARRAGHPDEETSEEWTTAANVARAAAKRVQRGRYETKTVEAECRWFGVTYKAPGEAEEIDLAGQNVPRGMAACKLRRGRMAKKCRTAAKKRGTTRKAALALRLAEDELAPRDMSVRETYLHAKRYGARGWPTSDS